LEKWKNATMEEWETIIAMVEHWKVAIMKCWNDRIMYRVSSM
jgi:hypothetical protein